MSAAPAAPPRRPSRPGTGLHPRPFMSLPARPAILPRPGCPRAHFTPRCGGWQARLHSQWQPSGRHRLALRGSAVSGRRAESFGGLSAAPARPDPGAYGQKTALILSGPSIWMTYRQPEALYLSIGRQKSPYRQKEGCILSENPVRMLFDVEGGPAEGLFPGHPDYLWRGLTYLSDRCPEKRLLVQKSRTPIPSNG